MSGWVCGWMRRMDGWGMMGGLVEECEAGWRNGWVRGEMCRMPTEWEMAS
jgi:hypothetical protein